MTSQAEEPTAEKRALAEVLFRDAKSLADEKKFDEACPKFQESHRLDPKPGTILNLAVCHEQQGKTASAWLDYLDAVTLTTRLGQKERAAFAKERAAELEKQLARLKVQVTESVTGLVVKVDGTEVSNAAWGTASPINPGQHSVEAIAPGYQTWSKPITVEKGPATIDVVIPKLEPVIAQKPPEITNSTPANSTTPTVANATTATTTTPIANVPPPPDSRGPNKLLWIGAGAGAVGLAGIIIGSVYGARTFDLRDAGNAECGPGAEDTYCTQKGLDLHAQAQTSATMSTVGFVLGATGIGAGAVLLVMALRSPSDKPNRAWILPAVGPSNAGFAAGLSF